ncbi:type II secretion system minor pseudopilin GspJ [Hellea balneolensis]|uniref:type II secretion system minor pseudopilin GspJ n=1 Tax=Hellea balneolensis TaxID=287478 RepID=UPI0004223B83|nr:type II secretion system minor pseudopilin GspJ [Hellea balneolensis]
MSTKPHKEAGFTLVEVLISLFIFAIITAGTMTALTQSLRGKDRLSASMETLNQFNAARSILRSDISALTLRPSRDELGGMNPYVLTTDGEALLSFTRRGTQNPSGLEQRGDLERVEYHFEDGALLRRSYAHENPAQLAASFDRVLLDNLEDVKLWAVIYQFNSFAKIEGVRLAANGSASLKPNAILFEVTDDFGEVTEHLFEIGA